MSSGSRPTVTSGTSSPGNPAMRSSSGAYGNTFGAGVPLLPGLTSADVTVVNAGGGNVSVTASYPYNPIFGFVPRFSFGGSVNVSGVNLQSSVTMRAL